MTHDWFSHMEEGHNAAGLMEVGCKTQLVNNVQTPLTPDDVQKLGCRPTDQVDRTFVLQSSAPGSIFQRRPYLSDARAEDIQQQQHGVVGRLATLRLR